MPTPTGSSNQVDRASRRTFDFAFDLVAGAGLGRLVSATYPLDRFEEAIAHAGAAGRRGAVKIVFDLRTTRRDRFWLAGRASLANRATGRKDSPDEPEARTRPGRRPVYPADAVLARRGLSPRAPSRRSQQGGLRTRAVGRAWSIP